jgi:hypothetical protein
VVAELDRFFANESGIDAIVRRPWLTRVAMPVLFAPSMEPHFVGEPAPHWPA